MTAFAGDALLLKIGNGGTPETFSTVGGLRGTDLAFNSRAIDTTNKASGQWQELLDNAGTRSVRIQASGTFTDSATETQVRQLAMSNSLRNFQITFGNGDTLQGSFKITNYGRGGDYRDQERYEITLESAGMLTFTAG